MQGNAKARREADRAAEAIRSGDRVALARAITLIESVKPEDQARAGDLLEHPESRRSSTSSA
jgi:GTPase